MRIEPLVPPEVDLRDFDYMPLMVKQLRDSDLASLATGDEFRAAVLLWSSAWHELPAASLPNDDRLLATLAGYGRDVKGWLKVKEVAMRGFELCGDGRFYHPLIADLAIEAWSKRRKVINKMKNVTAARLRKRADQRHVTTTRTTETNNDTSNDTTTNRKGIGKGREEDKEPSSSPATLPREAGLGFERKLREAAGWQNEPHPGLCVTGPIEAVIEAGADLERDVLPVIKALAPRVNTRTNWKYFVGPIRDAMTARLSAGAPVQGVTDAEQRKRDSARILAEHNARHANG